MFKVVRDILVDKSGKSLNRNDFDEAYNPFMIQRWLSMYSDLNVELLNKSVNNLYKTLNSEQQFMLLSVVLPSGPMRGAYIKTIKKGENKKKKKAGDDISASFEESSKKIEESLTLVLGEKNK